MPRAPVLSTRQVAPNVRAAPNVSPASVPGMGLAAGLSTLAGAVGEMAQKARDQANEVRLNDAEVKVRELRNRILNDPAKGLLSRRGTNAFTAPEDAEGEWRSGLSEISAELTDPDVRAAFEARADMLGVELRDVVNRHVSGEMDRVDADRTKAIIEDSLATIGQAPENLAQVDVDIARAEETMVGRLRRQGVAPEVLEAERAKLRSQARLAQIGALAAENPEMARAAFERYADDLQGKDRTDAQRTVERETLEARAQAGRDAIVREFTVETEALAAVKDRYSGQEEQMVRQYVVQDFADRARGRREVVQANTDAALQGIISGTGIPADVRRFLYENEPKTLDELTRYQTTRARGEEPETDYALFETLLQKYVDSPTQFAQEDLAQFRNRLSDRHYEELTRYKVGQRGPLQRVSPLAATRFVWEQARKNGVIPETVLVAADLKKQNTETRQRFAQFEASMKGALDAALVDNPRLTTAEQMAVMQGVIDNQVILSTGWLGGGRDTIPAAAQLPKDEVVGRTSGRKPMAARVNELRGQGMSRSEIERRMRAEGYGAEMDAVTP